MIKIQLLIIAGLALGSCGHCYAVTEVGVLPTDKEVEEAYADSIRKLNTSIFLNAESASKPRQVSLGLPNNSLGLSQIFEDGLPVSYYIYEMHPYKSYHGGMSAKVSGTMIPFETALRYGEINNYVDGQNRCGSSQFRGSVNYKIGTWGQNQLDVNISGPLGRGWGYSLSGYLNLDPGSNHTITPTFRDRHQFYKGVISKEFADGKVICALYSSMLTI